MRPKNGDGTDAPSAPVQAAEGAPVRDDLWDQAFRRLEQDQKDRVFYRHPYELALAKHHLASWLDDMAGRVRTAKYVPEFAAPFDVPKPEWHSRPAALISASDQLVYHYLILRALPAIAPTIKWSENSTRFSYRLAGTRDDRWFVSPFSGWRSFDEATLARLTSGRYSHVVLADIMAYYENIEIGRLLQALQILGLPEETTRPLSSLLNKWAATRQRGIPQSLSPSHVLGELYLDHVDRELQRLGFVHLRYVDDVRIFATSELEARRALLALTATLRERGLNIQGSKSGVKTAAAAAEEIDRVRGRLTEVSRSIGLELLSTGYATPEEVRDYIRADTSAPKRDVLERMWSEFADGEFNKTLFHFLLKRLAEVESAIAIEFVLETLAHRPEETEACLAYVRSVASGATAVLKRIAAVMSSPDTLFEYQRYQVLRWFWIEELYDQDVLAFCRGHVGAHANRLLWPHVVAYLGRFGEQGYDFDILVREYANVSTPLQKATILASLARAPHQIRNTLFARAQGEAPLVDTAIDLAKRR